MARLFVRFMSNIHLIWLPMVLFTMCLWRTLLASGQLRQFQFTGVRGSNHLGYKPFDQILHDYNHLLLLGPVQEWNYERDLDAWLNALVYNSFLQWSAGVFALKLGECAINFEIIINPSIQISCLRVIISLWVRPYLIF